MKILWQDLRYGVRMLMKQPGLTLVAALSLALGIGANTSMFSLVNAVFLRQLLVSEPGELMFVFSGAHNSPWSTVSYPNYVDYRDRNEVFSGLAAYGPITVSLNGNEQSEPADLVEGVIVTGNYFETLGVRAGLGRTISPEDDRTPNAHPVAVISHRLWQNRFGGVGDVIGREIALNGHRFTIIGVMPEGFEGAEILEKCEVYAPMMMQAVMRPPRGGFSGEMNPDLLQRRGPSWLRMIGRLKPGVSMEHAQAGMSVIASQLEQAYPNEYRGRIATLFPVSKIDPRAYKPLGAAAALLMSVVGMVLLIACANVANLLLARALARRKEIAVRLAMGASRLRLIRRLLTESVLLALLGGLVGLLVAFWTIDLLKTTPPPVGIFSFNLDRQRNDGDNSSQFVGANVVGANYLQTIGVPLSQGRDFTAADGESAPRVVIVNESFARQYFAGQSPLGRRLRFGGPRDPWSEIIGVARDSKYRTLDEASRPFIYLPLTQNHETGMTLHARAAGDPLNIAAAVRREINSIEKNLLTLRLKPRKENSK